MVLSLCCKNQETIGQPPGGDTQRKVMKSIQTAIRLKYPKATIIAMIQEAYACEYITTSQYKKLLKEIK